MIIKNSFEPLSEDELDEILIEIRSGSDDPLFVLERSEPNGGREERADSFV
jgi:hypothetical protein